MTLNNKSMTRKLGPILPGLWMILLTACTTSQPKNVKTVPDYAPDFLEEVAVDAKTCGPSAKEALYDWLVMIGG